jgi:hypothetical protein
MTRPAPVLPTSTGARVRLCPPTRHAGWCTAHLLHDLRSSCDSDPDRQLRAAAVAGQPSTQANHTAVLARERGIRSGAADRGVSGSETNSAAAWVIGECANLRSP